MKLIDPKTGKYIKPRSESWCIDCLFDSEDGCSYGLKNPSAKCERFVFRVRDMTTTTPHSS